MKFTSTITAIIMASAANAATVPDVAGALPLPSSALAALPSSALAALPSGVLGALPSGVLGAVPSGVLGDLPLPGGLPGLDDVSSLPTELISLLTSLPASLLSALPSLLSALPGIVSGLPAELQSLIPSDVLSSLPVSAGGLVRRANETLV